MERWRIFTSNLLLLHSSQQSQRRQRGRATSEFRVRFQKEHAFRGRNSWSSHYRLWLDKFTDGVPSPRQFRQLFEGIADITKHLDEGEMEILKLSEPTAADVSCKMQASILFPDTVSSSNNSTFRSKSGKTKKCVSFCESDQFFDTYYQTPFVNEEEEIIEDALHVDIESMISGDDSSSSHVSFTTLDKATAGSAFDTASFEDFPLRLSQVESEGPDRFSMDLVIQKLMNFQISLQPTISTGIVEDVAVIPFEDTNASKLILQSTFLDDDEEFIDRRQMSSNDDMMLELIRAASQSLIDHFKPSKEEPDESSLKKLQEDSMQMLLDEESDEENPIRNKALPPTGVSTSVPVTAKGHIKEMKSEISSAQATITKESTIDFIGLDRSSLSVCENEVTSHHIILNTNRDFKEQIQLTSTSQSIFLEQQSLYSSAEISSSGKLPESSSSYFTPDLKECSSSSKVQVLQAPISSTMSLNQLAAPPAVGVTEGSKVESQPMILTKHSSSNPSFLSSATTHDMKTDSTQVLSTSPDKERSSIHLPQSVMPIISTVSNGSTQDSKYSNGKGNDHIDDDLQSGITTLDYPIPSSSNTISFNTLANNELSCKSRDNIGNGNSTEMYDCLKEGSVGTTNPCDSRRPSLYDTPPPTGRGIEIDQIRGRPYNCVVPITDDGLDVQPSNGLRSRRQERLENHEAAGIDMAKGRERYLIWKLYFNVFLLWLLLPIIFCVIIYGVIPYDYAATVNHNGTSNNSSLSTVQNSHVRILKAATNANSDAVISIDVWAVCMIPWILIMASASASAVQIYSTVISEVEFGVQIWQDSPLDYFRVAILAISAALAMQILIFSSWGPGHVRNWLCMIAVASGVVGILLQRMFYAKKDPNNTTSISEEKVDIFKRFMRGLFILFCISVVGFTIFTILYAQFAISRGGSIGFLLATLFPFCRVVLHTIVERCPGVFWRDCKGGLCAGAIVTLIMSMWHGVFLSLIAACVASIQELIVLGAVELSLQLFVIYIISRLPPPCATLKDAYDDAHRRHACHNTSIKNSRLLSFGFEGRHKVAVNSDCDIEYGKDGKPFNTDECNGTETDGISSTAPATGNAGVLSIDEVYKGANKLDLATSFSNNHILSFDNNDTDVGTTALHKTSIKGRGRMRTHDDDVYESRLATWLGVTWISGALTPLAFLICSALLSIGPNRRLFSAKVNNWRAVGGPSFGEVADIEVVAGHSRLWSLSVFDRDASDLHKLMWSVPSSVKGSKYSEWGSTHLVGKMLCVSLAHIAMLIIGLLWFSKRESKGKNEVVLLNLRGNTDIRFKESLNNGSNDSRALNDSRTSCGLCGLMNALLEHHYNIIALSTVMTMAIILSVVFPWYGMNTSF